MSLAANHETLAGEGLWQLVEFGDYRADLAFWSELADACDGPVLDLGCGIGRVALDLSRHGHRVTGVDRDPAMVEAFNRLAGSDAVAVVADATELLDPSGPLGAQRFGLVIAPQQFVQLMGSPDARRRLLQAVNQLLTPGGTAAFAICEQLPGYSVHFPGAVPDAREVGAWYHSSLPLAIEPSPTSVSSIRLRQSVGPGGELRESEDTVEIDRIDRPTLEAELLDCGLVPMSPRAIPQTDRHMGSTVVRARRPAGQKPA